MRKHKLIIVEDDEDEQMFMREAFETAGLFDLLAQVKNGEQLFGLLADPDSELPDFVLSDLNMPGKNGYDIIAGMASTPRLAHIPVIITSTSSTKTLIDKCIALGAALYLVKPDTFLEYGTYVEQLYNAVKEKNLIK